MNDYETRRLEKIKKNQALLAELDIKPIVAQKRDPNGRPPVKKRKIVQETIPSRTSARLATTTKPSYNEDELSKPISLPRSAPKRGKKSSKSNTETVIKEETEPLIPAKNVAEIVAGWTDWTPTADPPTRDEDYTFHFSDHPTFLPNKSPSEMLREGAFGGSYYRALRSAKLGIIVSSEDWRELPDEWIAGLNVERFLTSATYDPDVNKFGVSCGQSIEEWEAAGWISHEHDIRGWFQWYTRFFRGRRCEDDERQVSRWRKCVGETGRWRRMLLKKYRQAGVREVWDDGEDEDAIQVSPVMHQTCHHWAFEIRQGVLDEFWAEG